MTWFAWWDGRRLIISMEPVASWLSQTPLLMLASYMWKEHPPNSLCSVLRICPSSSYPCGNLCRALATPAAKPLEIQLPLLNYMPPITLGSKVTPRKLPLFYDMQILYGAPIVKFPCLYCDLQHGPRTLHKYPRTRSDFQEPGEARFAGCKPNRLMRVAYLNTIKQTPKKWFLE